MKRKMTLMAFIAMVLLGACTGGSKDEGSNAQTDTKPLIKIALVQERPVEQIQEYTATVEAEVTNNIAPMQVVRIEKIYVEVGDRVAKGQKLVQMDASNL
ncbi:MAG: efflux transporter periplasmic adaptor subunit, partial [Tannerella sp.]|nr:efflux transporter periplasmic adaptor subunit [Tannerella sp.]